MEFGLFVFRLATLSYEHGTFAPMFDPNQSRIFPDSIILETLLTHKQENVRKVQLALPKGQ